jgi:serine-type D-Ala-D-Ala carboxypeptidase
MHIGAFPKENGFMYRWFVLICAMHLYGVEAVTANTTQSTGSAPLELQQNETITQKVKPLPNALPQTVGMNPEGLSRKIDAAFAAAIASKEICGGVVVVVRYGKIAFEKAYGKRSVDPSDEAATVDTIYDMASLTKPLATGSAIMRLVEEGKIRLNDPVKKFIPEWKDTSETKKLVSDADQFWRYVKLGALRPNLSLFEPSTFPRETMTGPVKESPEILVKRLGLAGGIRFNAAAWQDLVDIGPYSREDVTIRHLLTHTSGLDPFDRYYLKFPERHARAKIIASIAQRPLVARPGTVFRYSDLGFITLGEVVEQVTSQTEDQFCRKEIFEPLGMTDTGYNPSPDLLDRVAPTEWRTDVTTVTKDGKETTSGKKVMARGEVHDGNALVRDGVSGHAGLFSTAGDVARYAAMLLNGGELQGVRIFSPLTVKALSTDRAELKSGEKRGLAWDIRTSYSGPRGDLFDSGFGHTGFTGTSIWIVPNEKLAVIILSNRVHPDGKGDAGPLRGHVANAVASSIIDSYVEKNHPAKEDQ